MHNCILEYTISNFTEINVLVLTEQFNPETKNPETNTDSTSASFLHYK